MTRGIKLSVIGIIAFAFLFAGCKEQEEHDEHEHCCSNPEYHYEGEMKFTGLEKEFTILFEDIYGMGADTIDIHCIENGEEVIYSQAGGVYLEALVRDEGVDIKMYDSIKFIAQSGEYAEIPNEILMETDIIMVYTLNGEFLPEENRPMMILAEGLDTKYVISNIIEVEFVKASIDN